MTLLRYWRWIAALAAAALGWITTSLPADLTDFGDLGQRIINGQFNHVYDGVWNQAGPLQLVISRLLLIAGHDGMPAPATMAAIDAALMLAAVTVTGRSRDTPGLRELATAGLALLWLAGPVPWNGHPAEVAVPICWSGAVVLQRRSRPTLAAVLLAAAVMIAPWALLGFGCLLAAAPLRRAVLTAVLAVTLGALGYLPFAATGSFAMFSQVWDVAPGSLIHLFAPDLKYVDWPVRLVQGAVVAGGCAVIAHRFPDDRLAIGAAPLAAALLRVATDPLTYTYYWTPVAAGTVLLLALTPDNHSRPRQALTITVGYSALLAESIGSPAGALATVALLVVLLRPARTRMAPTITPLGSVHVSG